MENMSVKDLIDNIKILNIKPNEALCVTLSHLCSADELRGLSNFLKAELGCKVIILAPGTELSIVRVEDEDSSN